MAAYIDGTLSKAESARITEHLASCESCYAVYMETLHFKREEDQGDRREGDQEEGEELAAAEVVQFRRPGEKQPAEIAQKSGTAGGSWRSPVRWLPLAALLLVGVGGGTYFYFEFLSAPPQLVKTPAPPTLASLPQGDQALWLGPTYRGEGGEEEAKVNESSFRMGVQIVNLQATLQAGQARESQDIIARILNLLKPLPFTDDFQKSYIGITNTVEKRPPAELLSEAARLAQETRDPFDPTSLDLGQWVEAARLAALAHSPSFFQKSENQAFLRRLRWNDKLGRNDVKLDPATRASLDRISAIISKSDLRPSDYAKLQHELETILNTHYPQT